MKRLIALALAAMYVVTLATPGAASCDKLNAGPAEEATVVKFTGTAVDMADFFGFSWWEVDVHEVISGPSLASTVSVLVWSIVDPGCDPGRGYVDPDMKAGDLVEVYGRFDSEESVLVCESEAYYIRRATPTSTRTPTGCIVYLPIVLRCWPLLAPQTPTLYDIDNPDGDGNYTVSWSSVPSCQSVNSYTLHEDYAPSFPSPARVYSGLDSSKAVSGKDIGTYYYRVQASNDVGSSDWSSTKSVVVTGLAPSCGVTCEADAGGWSVNITCESGASTSRSQSLRYHDDTRGWVTLYSIDRTYTNSGNTYHISAEYWRVYPGGNAVGRISLNVTGGVFGENAQHCQNY
jgi:hypothetical protein